MLVGVVSGDVYVEGRQGEAVTLVSHELDRTGQVFMHQAALYAGAEGFVEQVVPFVRDAIAAGEPVLAALPPARGRLLEAALGTDAIRVDFVDMTELGRNPACILPEWRRFVDEFGADGPVRGVAEPVWPGRRPVEVEECWLHEALMDVAFADGPGWRLLCPYDVTALPGEVVRRARRSHATSHVLGRPDGAPAGDETAAALFTTPLPAAPPGADALPFGPADLSGLRGAVRRLTEQAGVPECSAGDVVLAAHELAVNSVTHGAGCGTLLAWREPDAFVLEVRDGGRIVDPLVGREQAFDAAECGRGIWIANQICDLVQVRSSSQGAAVRLFTWL